MIKYESNNYFSPSLYKLFTLFEFCRIYNVLVVSKVTLYLNYVFILKLDSLKDRQAQIFDYLKRKISSSYGSCPVNPWCFKICFEILFYFLKLLLWSLFIFIFFVMDVLMVLSPENQFFLVVRFFSCTSLSLIFIMNLAKNRLCFKLINFF